MTATPSPTFSIMSPSISPEKSLAVENLRRIRAALPPAAFQPNPGRLVGMFLLIAVFLAAHRAVAYAGLSWWLIAPVVVSAVALSAIAFATHDLAHGSILRPGRTQRACELLFWGLVLIAPTVWRRVHNQSHHSSYNTPDDPDRQFLAEESSPATRWYTWLLYPNAEVFPWNPLVLVHFIPYIVRNTVAALLPARWKPAFVPRRADFQAGDAVRIAGELAVILALQAGLFLLTGGRVLPYLIMAAGTQTLTSAVTMTYIFTNHFINPLSHEPDPITGTTSVIVPAWIDRFHSNFSYHTEHHMFPALNSDYYPALSRELRKIYPATYQRIPIGEAWRRLWENRAFPVSPVGEVDRAG